MEELLVAVSQVPNEPTNSEEQRAAQKGLKCAKAEDCAVGYKMEDDPGCEHNIGDG